MAASEVTAIVTRVDIHFKFLKKTIQVLQYLSNKFYKTILCQGLPLSQYADT